MTSADVHTRLLVAVAMALLTVAVVGANGSAAYGSEPAEARGIDGACSRATQAASARTEHPAPGFADVAGNVHEAAVNCLAHWDIARGYHGAYLPGEPVQRDQMASLLARMVRRTDYELPRKQQEPAFGDTAGNVHADNVTALAEAGIVEGRAGGSYAPDEPVSRAAMASFVARTLETVTGENLTGTTESPFPDTAGSVHEGNIDALASLGIVQGRSDGTYAPDQTVRRDQMASFLARAMDYLAAQGHWPMPTTVELSPPEATNPANFIHRLGGTVFDQWGQEADNGLHAADVRFEVYRETYSGHSLVHTDQVVSGLGGDLSFSYNADATVGDRDVLAACPVTLADDPPEQDPWCVDVDRTESGEAALAPVEGRGADTVTASWSEPVDVQAASRGHYPGNAVAHDEQRGTVDLQTARQPDGDGEALVRVGYNAADRFILSPFEGEESSASPEEFSCAVQAALAHDDEAYPPLTVDYDPDGESLFALSTPARLAHCLSLTNTCDNPDGGFRINYPEGWHTNEPGVTAPLSGEPVDACRYFHPEPFNPDQHGDRLAVGVAVTNIRAEDYRPYNPDIDEVTKQQLTVDDFPGVRIDATAGDYRAHPEGHPPPWNRLRAHVIDAGDRRILVTTSDYAEGISFPNAAAAHERMVASLDIDE